MKDYDFYIVPTPIGNLGDITLRAIEILKSVDLIACEDMRVTQKLLNHYSIDTKCVSYHKFNEKEQVNYLLSQINAGKKIALVSDAGTPLFCDPGAVLVKELIQNNINFTALPGANAVVTFLSHVPRNTEEFAFVGFLPRTDSQIKTLLNQYKKADMVFYESPNRLLATLNIIKNNNQNSTVSIGRELSKVFEEVVTDNVQNIINYFSENTLKGEIVGMIHGTTLANDISEYNDKIETLLNKGYSSKDISVILSSLFDINKNKVYEHIKKL